MSIARKYAVTPSRGVSCQICPWSGTRWYGKGMLVKPCPECGSRVKFTVEWKGELPANAGPEVNGTGGLDGRLIYSGEQATYGRAN
jgi:hypothetical protein